MRWLLTLALLALAAWPAAAQENEAEKLFRDLEQKVRTAKTLQIRFDAIITGAEVKKTDDKKKVDAKNWHVKGSVILGEGDKLRAEYEGNLFGQENKRTFVSDGSDWTSFGHTQKPGEAKVNFRGTEKTPKAIGAYLRPALPRDGFVLSFITDRRSQLAPDLFILSDFKLAGEEKIGERNTQVIQYTVMPKAKDPSFGTPNVNVTTMKLSMKVWLDTKTKLPVKLAMTGGDSNFNAITETYSEFIVDAKVDAKLFELPKGPNLDQSLDLNGTQVTDAVLKEKLAGLKNVQSLSLIGTQVTDAGLKELAGLKSLQVLNLNGTKVTDAGLKELAGLKSLQNLDLGSTRVTDAGLKELAGLKTLRSLGLGGTEVTDAGLKEFASLKNLQFLNLGVTKVTDAGLKELAGLKSLQFLDLGATEVTDAGLKELAGFKSLLNLGLTGTQVTDAGLKELAGLKSLHFLDLGRTQVTNAGLKELAGLKSLQTLWLGRTKVTDAGLKELAGLKSLQFLDLGGTDVTDAGLKELAGLDSLQTLGLISTKVTDAGVAELRKALPKVDVIRR